MVLGMNQLALMNLGLMKIPEPPAARITVCSEDDRTEGRVSDARRLQIISALKSNGPMNAYGLAEIMDCAPNTVRNYLSVMQKRHLVTPIGKTQNCITWSA